MAANATQIAAKAKNPAFLSAIGQALSREARDKLGSIAAVAPAATGYVAYRKLTEWYAKVALAPEVYAQAFARLALDVDDTRDVETDASTIASWIDAGAPQSIARALAGVTLQDDN
jgi:hypothetical protein